MPIARFEMPDGRIARFEVPEGTTPEQAQSMMARAARDLPKPKSGILANLMKGTEEFASSGVGGISSLVGDPNAAARGMRERSQSIEDRYADEVGLDKLASVYNKDGLFAGIKEVGRQVPLAIAQQAPNLAATVGGARLGAMAGAAAGAPFAGVGAGPGALIGGALGAFAPSAIQALGSHVQRQDKENPNEKISMGAAVPTAVVSGALDTAATLVPFGKQLVGKMLGKEVANMFAQGARKEVEELAKETLLKSAARGTVIGGAAEIPTEVMQQMLERAQAGLQLFSPDALKEYKDTAYQTSLLAPMGGGARMLARGNAKSTVAGYEAEDKAKAAQQAQEQAEEDARLAAEQAATPTVEGGLFPTAEVPATPDTNLLGQPVQQDAAANIPSAEDITLQHADYQRKVTNLTGALEEQRGKVAMAAQLGEHDIALEESAKFRTMEKALRALEAEAKALPPAPKAGPTGDELNKALARAKQDLAKAGELGDIDAIERATKRIKTLQAANPDLFTKEHNATIQADQDALAGEMATGRETEADKRARVEREKAGLRGLAERDGQPNFAGQARQERQVGNEITAMGQNRLDTEVTEQGALFPEETGAGVKPAAETTKAQRDRLVLQLQEALRQRKDDPQKYRPVVDGLLEQLRTLKEKPLLARQPRGAATAEVAPDLAGTNMPETLPPSADGVPVERSYTAAAPALRAAVAAAPQDNPLVAQIKEAMATPPVPAGPLRTLPSVAKMPQKPRASVLSGQGAMDVMQYLHQLRIGQDTTDSAARVQEHLQALEEGKRSDEKSTENMFPDTELQGHIFETPEGFQRYLASEGLNEVRKAVGLALQTVSRARAVVAPLEAKAAELRESIVNLGRTLEATKATGGEKIERAQEAHAKALERVRELERALDKKMRPAQAAVVAADLELSKAQGARAKVLDSIAKNQTKFGRDADLKVAATIAAKAARMYADMQETLAKNGKGDPLEELPPLYAKVLRADNAYRVLLEEHIRAGAKLQERSILAFLNKDMELQLQLADAQIVVDSARAKLDGAKAQLDTVLKEITEGTQVQAEMRVNKRNEAHARGVLTKARGSMERTVDKTTKELQAADDQRQAAERNIREELEPVEKAQAARVAPPMEETQAQREARDAEQRKADNARTERLQALPGVTVSHEELRKAIDKLDALPEKIRAADARAKDKDATEAARKKGAHDAKVLRNEAKMAHSLLSNDPDTVASAKRLLDAHVADLEAKVDAKKAAVAEPGKAKSTISSRRKELSELQAKLREMRKLQKQITGRAEITPIATAEDKAQAAYEREALQRMERGIALETEGTTGRLPARKIGPMVRPEVLAGNIRTGELGTVGQRMLPARSKLTQSGKARGVSGTQAVRKAGADTAQEHAMLEMSRIEDLQERNEAALENAQEARDAARIEKHKGYATRLEAAHDAVEKQLEKAARGTPDRKLISSPEDMETPSVERDARTSTALSPEAVEAAHDGRILDVVQDLAENGSTPEVRAMAAKLKPLVMRTKLKVDDGVKHNGKSVAGLYAPETNAATLHTQGLTEEDTLHELSHAATDRVLLADPKTLTPEQRKARAGLEGMQKQLVHHPAFKDEHIPNVREFVAEVNSNPELRAKMDALGTPLSLLDRFKNFIRSLLGLPPKTPTQKAQDLIDKILMPSRRIEGTSAPSVRRTAAAELANEIIAQPKSFKERYAKNFGLSMEMWAVDMRAPLMKALGAAGEHAAEQAAYYIRKADARMSHTYAVLTGGPLQFRKVDKGHTIIEAGNGPSAKEVFAAVAKIPGLKGADKMKLAQVYLTAKRAGRVGWDKLGFDPERITELQTKANAMMAEVSADPTTKAALEEVSKIYGQYNKGLIEFMAASGAMSKAEAAELLKHNDYVPFYRVKPDGTAELVLSEDNVYPVGNIRTQPYLKELKGGDQQLLPLNESLVRNTMLLTDMAMRNIATKDVAYALQSIGATAKKMKIRTGPGEASPNTIRFKQDGEEYHLVIDTEGTAVEGIPADMLAHSLEGSFSAMPAFLKVAGWFGDVLRSGVTRNPMYIARQLVRDPMAAAFTAGLDSGPLTATAKSVKEFVSQMTGNSETATKLLQKGVVHSNIFTGDVDDMAKMGMQIANGDQSAYHKFLAGWDAAAMRADASTRAQMYDSAIKQGASEMEAEMQAMEMMNFNKRGISPTVQFASRMIPFFNAQIQGLNVLYKAATGNMPMNEKLKIKEKFFKRAMFMAGMTMMYAAAMDDDDTYKNARARDRYGNFLVPNPLGGEHLKIPIPFEVGVLFKALPEAMVDAMKGQFGAQEWKAIRQMFLQQIPGSGSYGVPQIARPALEVMSNANWFSGNQIESDADQRLSPQERFGRNTSELAKTLSNSMSGAMSPKQIEHLVNGYLGSLPIAVARMTNAVFASEEVNGTTPTSRGSDLPVFGALFQKQYGGGPVDAAYAQAQALEQSANTYKKMLTEGRAADAAQYKENATNVIASPQLAKRYTSQMAKFKQAEDAIRRVEKDPDRMRERLDWLDKQRSDFSKLYVHAVESLAR